MEETAADIHQLETGFGCHMAKLGLVQVTAILLHKLQVIGLLLHMLHVRSDVQNISMVMSHGRHLAARSHLLKRSWHTLPVKRSCHNLLSKHSLVVRILEVAVAVLDSWRQPS